MCQILKSDIMILKVTSGPLVQKLERLIRIGFRKEGIPYEKFKESSNAYHCIYDSYDDA